MANNSESCIDVGTQTFRYFALLNTEEVTIDRLSKELKRLERLELYEECVYIRNAIEAYSKLINETE